MKKWQIEKAVKGLSMFYWQILYIIFSIFLFSFCFIVQDIPSYGCVQECMVCRYTVHNRTKKVLEVEVMVNASGAFMSAGSSQVELQSFKCQCLPYVRKKSTLSDWICYSYLLIYAKIKCKALYKNVVIISFMIVLHIDSFTYV